MVNTSPIMKPVMPTKDRDLYPIRKDCFINSLNSYGGFNTSLKKRSVNTVSEDTSKKNLSKAESAMLFEDFTRWSSAS